MFTLTELANRTSHSIRARFLVDSSGRASVGKQFKIKKTHEHLQKLSRAENISHYEDHAQHCNGEEHIDYQFTTDKPIN
jgi:hypothetical protein